MSGAIYNVESISVVWYDGWGTKSCVELKPAAPQTSSGPPGPHGLKSPAGPGVAHILHKFSQPNCDTGIYACTINCRIGTLSCDFPFWRGFSYWCHLGPKDIWISKGQRVVKQVLHTEYFVYLCPKKCDLIRKNHPKHSKNQNRLLLFYMGSSKSRVEELQFNHFF